MANLQKTIEILFTGNVSDAQAKVDDLAKSFATIGDTATEGGGLSNVSDSFDGVAEKAKNAQEQTRVFIDKLKEVGQQAGISRDSFDKIESAFLRIGAPGVGAAAVAAGAITAFGLAVGLLGGAQFNEFENKVRNLGDGLIDSGDKVDDLKRIVGDLETELSETADAYFRFLEDLSGSKLAGSRQIIEDAFIGIADRIKGTGGNFGDTQRALKDFADAAGDEIITLKELEEKLDSIPGGMQTFADALGIPIDDLKALADANKLGRDEIALFAQTLRESDYESLTPIKDALNDFFNTLKIFADEFGAGTAVEFLFEAIARGVRALTAAAVTGLGGLELFGRTIGNFFALIAGQQSWEQFKDNQAEAFDGFAERIQPALDKMLDFKKTLGDTEAADTAKDKYRDLAEKLRDSGDATGKTDSKTKDLQRTMKDVSGQRDYERSLIEAAKAADKAREASDKFKLEMEKLASNERIKFIEAKVKIDVASVQADAEKVIKAFDSINKTIESTGDVISTIFEAFKDINGLDSSARNKLFEQLEIENKRRGDALQLQRRLTEAQIRVLEAQREKIQDGDALIKIDGAGLQPHLEAFMWEILKAIQTRVNQDGLALLLGV